MPQGNLCYYCFRTGRSKPYTELQTKELDKRLAANEEFKKRAGLPCAQCTHLHGSHARTHLRVEPSLIFQASSHCQRASQHCCHTAALLASKLPTFLTVQEPSS